MATKNLEYEEEEVFLKPLTVNQRCDVFLELEKTVKDIGKSRSFGSSKVFKTTLKKYENLVSDFEASCYNLFIDL